MTREEVIAEHAARAAVKKTFSLLGVNVEDPAQVEEFRRDLRWAGDWRRAQGKGVTAIIVSLFMFMGGAFWLGLRTKIGG